MEIAGSADPETQFLYSEQKTGNEWELFKENVRPLKRGRNVQLLNAGLKSQTNNQLKRSLEETRRKLIQAIDDYSGDDPLQPWLECIKWVQESFPPGGDCSGLVVIYEQCVRTFWHSDRYKDDLRYLKVWLEYAEHCADAEVIYSFLDANRIGMTHSLFYISYALHLESKNKSRLADDVFHRGRSGNAQPKEKLEAAYRRFFVRSMRQPKVASEDSTENQVPARSFGTVLTAPENRRLLTGQSDISRKKSKANRPNDDSFKIYKDSNSVDDTLSLEENAPHADLISWRKLGSRVERNKENTAIPSKWKNLKIPQKHVSRTEGMTASSIEVYVDGECAEAQTMEPELDKSSTLQLRPGDGGDLKREAELLRKNPLRKFPPNSLPR